MTPALTGSGKVPTWRTESVMAASAVEAEKARGNPHRLASPAPAKPYDGFPRINPPGQSLVYDAVHTEPEQPYGPPPRALGGVPYSATPQSFPHPPPPNPPKNGPWRDLDTSDRIWFPKTLSEPSWKAKADPNHVANQVESLARQLGRRGPIAKAMEEANTARTVKALTSFTEATSGARQGEMFQSGLIGS